jgi:hypothetical protein
MALVLKKQVRLEQSPTKNILINDLAGDFYECNDTALFVLQQLLNSTSREAIAQALLAKYDITDREAYIQVDYSLSLLNTLGVLDEQI